MQGWGSQTQVAMLSRFSMWVADQSDDRVLETLDAFVTTTGVVG